MYFSPAIPVAPRSGRFKLIRTTAASLPGATTVLSGTYDATTGAFTLTWKSLIVGGPFNGFIGLWHLVGHFVPAP